MLMSTMAVGSTSASKMLGKNGNGNKIQINFNSYNKMGNNMNTNVKNESIDKNNKITKIQPLDSHNIIKSYKSL